MRLPLIVLVAGLTAGCGSLDKTPGEVEGDLRSWMDSVFDAHVSVGDIIIYFIIGGIAIFNGVIIFAFLFVLIESAMEAPQRKVEAEKLRQGEVAWIEALKQDVLSGEIDMDEWRSLIDELSDCWSDDERDELEAALENELQRQRAEAENDPDDSR